jgi:putative membrane protein
VRFWDARAAAVKLVELCRVLAGEVCAYYPHHPRGRNDLLRWIVVFPIACKNFLRAYSGAGVRRTELEPLLSPSEASALLAAHCPPLHVLAHFRMLILQMAMTLSEEDEPAECTAETERTESARSAAQAAAFESSLRPFIFRGLSEITNQMTATFGAMERISGTPLSFAYVTHLRTLLVLVLAFLPLGLISRGGVLALPGYYLLCWALLGIEAAAVECERPFLRKANHLPFGKFALVVARDISDILRDSVIPQSAGAAAAKGKATDCSDRDDDDASTPRPET